MLLATRRNGSADGELVVVSADQQRCLPAGPELPNLLTAIERWPAARSALTIVADGLARGDGEPLDPRMLAAPLPRTWQWLDGSAFGTHSKLMQIAFGLDPIDSSRPLMYQGLSDRFYGATDDVPFSSEAHGIDFEGEFGIVVDEVPMGTSAADALAHIKLIVQINDWSLRAIAPIEMKTGFGWVQAKPACSMAPFAITPDELGDHWNDGRVAIDLVIDLNGRRFGAANGGAMEFGFHDLIAHAALTRDLVAGTIIGSGTVSNGNYREVGSSCISEVRAAEIVSAGAAATPFLAYGDRVRMAGRAADGREPFGAIDQRVVDAET